MRSDADHYFDLLMGLDAALHAMREVIADHEECPGCDLCADCYGMEHTTRIYLDLVRCDAPWPAAKRWKDKSLTYEGNQFKELLDNQADDTPAPAPAQEPEADRPAVVAELPASRTRPYWLAAE